MRFSTEIRSDLSAEEMWKEFRRVIENSHQSWRWPNRLESIHSPGLRVGSILDVVYKVGSLERRVHYVITHLQEGKSFSYRSQSDHPLLGGGTVEIRSKGNGSILRWKGEYRIRRDHWAQSLPAALFFRFFFRKRFFDELEEGFGLASDHRHVAGFQQTLRGDSARPSARRAKVSRGVSRRASAKRTNQSASG